MFARTKEQFYADWPGATTLRITTLNVMTFCVTTLNIMTLSLKTFSTTAV
jgi:hypothetical protein